MRSVDRISIGNGSRGDITAQIQKRFFEITSGEREAPGPWLTYVRDEQKWAVDETRAATTGGPNGSGKATTTASDPTAKTKLVARAAGAVAAD